MAKRFLAQIFGSMLYLGSIFRLEDQVNPVNQQPAPALDGTKE